MFSPPLLQYGRSVNMNIRAGTLKETRNVSLPGPHFLTDPKELLVYSPPANIDLPLYSSLSLTTLGILAIKSL